MAKVFIKYNPFKLETIIEIDGELVPENSVLNVGSKRLQEWVEQLPEFLQDECNEDYFELDFMGTSMDLEDVEEIIKKARKNGIEIELTHIPVQEISNMEFAIEEVFDEIINGPIEELKSKDLQDAFKKALNDEFEITVVATMSAGKSTLINSLLQRKLMPSSQEACTATISRIKDTDDEDFFATAYDEFGNVIKSVPNLGLEDMEKLNATEKVSSICIEGDIPFTSTEEMSLVLIDTPGPNNSRDENHLKTTYKNLDESSKALVLYILNATQLGVNDDSQLLNAVANSMQIGGKQSKDRYLFVVNKLDQFRKGDDDVESSLQKVRKYLADRGIHDPNIFPAAALSSLDIRELLNHPESVDEDLEDEILMMARKLNRNEQLHLEKYATLTPSIRRKIDEQLRLVDDGDIMNLETALIHSGIPAVEETIKLYVEKYARTAKIKNVVDTFQKKLESSKAFEETKTAIAENTERHAQIKEQICKIEEKLNSGKEAERFKNKIEEIDVMKDIKTESKKLVLKHQRSIDEFLTGSIGKEFSKNEAESFIENLIRISRESHSKLTVNLEKMINENLSNIADQLLKEYKEKIAKLIDGLGTENLVFEPLQLIAAELDFGIEKNRILDTATYTEKIKVGTESYSNPERSGFFGSLKFWKPKTLYRDVYEEQSKVSAQIISDEFSTFLEKQNRMLIKEVEGSAKENIKQIKIDYYRKFDKVDQILRNKLKELEIFTQDESLIRAKIAESQARLGWLERINEKVNKIIDIGEVVEV
ncbi:dynamin family protein [Solibacillus daqui]|uniref:dynamin family protein n=1 Tax=Solibacillus daqui TaxID=2912187 RepID=UPI0023650A20|nr:dynamin family protein [Solibacillus daqui]